MHLIDGVHGTIAPCETMLSAIFACTVKT